MGWSKTNPSGGTWTHLAEQTTTQNRWQITSRISYKRVGNTCVVAFEYKLHWGEYGYDGYVPENYYGCQVDPTSPNLASSTKLLAHPSSVSAYTDWWYYTYTCPSASAVATQMFSATDAGGTGLSRITGQARSFTIPAATYTVTLDRAGGTGGTASVTATYGAAMPGITVPSRAGYTFGGYYTGTNGSGTQYYTASGASARSCALTADTTLYAKWTANNYTITLDRQNGSGGTTSVIVTYGAAMPDIAAPSRAGYTFGGYYTGTNGSGTQYYTASGTSANTCALTADTTLYAKWTANSYTVSFDSRGGSACGSISVTYGSTYGTLPTPTRTNYTFTGWFTDPEGGTQITGSTAVSITDDRTLYAHWTLNAVTITYYGNGTGVTGIPAAQDKLIGGTATISSAVPVRNGFTFLGWNTSPVGSGTGYSGGDSYSTDADLNLYAQWAEIPEISDITAVRCNSSGATTDTDADTYAVIGFGWATDPAVTGAAYTIRWVNRENASNTGSSSGTLSGTSGTVSNILCGAATGAVSAIETAYQYDVTITVTDSNGGTGVADDFVSRAYYVLDFTAGGLGIGIGAPARDGRITTGLPHTADAEERGTHYELIRNATDATLLRSMDWEGNETILGDLTAGGEIKDGSGNVLSGKADAADVYTKEETLALFLDRTYPVGAIYLSAVSTSPASLFGGTWERITGKFLLAATDNGSSGASQAAGNTGGEATVTLTANQSGQRALSITGGGHSHTVHAKHGTKFASGSTRGFHNDGDVVSNSMAYIDANTGTHSHSVSAANASEAHENMPPYLAVYVWKRIS